MSQISITFPVAYVRNWMEMILDSSINSDRANLNRIILHACEHMGFVVIGGVDENGNPTGFKRIEEGVEHLELFDKDALIKYVNTPEFIEAKPDWHAILMSKCMSKSG